MGNPKRRIVVPTAARPRRPLNNQRSTKPEWMNGALADTAIVIGVMLATTLFLLLLSGQLHDTTAGDLIAKSAAPLPLNTTSPDQTALSHPTPSPRFTSTAPSPSPTATPAIDESTANVPDDAAIQEAIDKKLQSSAELSSLNVIATVTAGKVVVVGSVASDELKEKVERLLRSVKGVRQVDNQIAVVSGD